MTAAGTSARFASGVAIIAGGSGGIGAEIARALADAGSDVALTCNKNRANAEAPITGQTLMVDGGFAV